MSLTSPSNRRLSALVALLYVFFSTFGALTHNHAPAVRTSAIQDTVFALTTGHAAPAHCAVCDWQSLQVTPPVAGTPLVQPRLLTLQTVTLSYHLPALPSFRSSSRGPPRT